MDEILQVLPNETEDECLFRIGEAKRDGLLDLTWTEISDFFNKEFRKDETEYRTESSYRKKFKKYIDAKDVLSKQNMLDNNTANKIETKLRELEKAKKQFEDQRRECKKLWTAEARFDNLTDKLIESVNRLCYENPLEFDDYVRECGDKEAVLCLADWHYGMVTDNIWNKYNTDICRKRVSQLAVKTIDYLQLHNVNTLHIMLLGDAAHGALHTSCRVASEEDTCDQLMHVSEIIAEFINELSKYTSEVNVYATYGNHLRTVQNKNDSIHSDNMEKIIGWYLEQRLQNNHRVNIIKSDYYEFIFLNVCGYNIVGAHGDLEKFKQFGLTVNTLFTKKYGQTINYTISADRHHIEEFETIGIESILVRSLCGTDEYSNKNRLYSAPGQTLMIFSSSEGRECTYNIKLD